MIPVFNTDAEPSPQVREFISTEVLKACITSLNEPYFVDVQRDLATLIANIIHLYADKTSTPARVLLSLPDMDPRRVDDAVAKIKDAASERQQRAHVLALLEGVRGVSIHEAGRIQPRPTPASKRSKMQQAYMEVDGSAGKSADGTRGESPGLEGMANLFGDA